MSLVFFRYEMPSERREEREKEILEEKQRRADEKCERGAMPKLNLYEKVALCGRNI